MKNKNSGKSELDNKFGAKFSHFAISSAVVLRNLLMFRQFRLKVNNEQTTETEHLQL